MVKIKGTTVLDTIRAVREREGEQGLDQVLGQLAGETQRLFRGEILPSAWYPLDAFTEFLDADLRQTARGNEQVLAGRAAAVVEEQLRGTYRAFARSPTPQAMIKRLSAIHETYFQGVTIAFECTEPGRARVEYIGFAEQHRLMTHVLIGFYRKTLEVCGAKQIGVDLHRSGPSTRQHWELSLTWR